MESGLIGLRAELQKKQVEVAKYGSGQRGIAGREREAIRPTAFSASNVGVSGRAAKDEEQHQDEERTEEKAREILKKKAAMYDKINQGIEVLEDDHLNQRFLINFQKKIVADVMEKKKMRDSKQKTGKQEKKGEDVHPDDYHAKNSEEEWVEYTDAFGRTRKCLKNELSEMLDQDKQLSQDLNSMEPKEKTIIDPKHLQDIHREALRQKWEAEEELNTSKKDIHYQDVMYDEARTHGPGYLKFSRDEAIRKAQMELLQDLQAETKQAKATTAAVADKRKKAMKARLEKVRQKKRLKMGLPIKDEDQLRTPPESEEEDEHQVVDTPPTPPSPPPRKKVGGVREWDLGKEGVTSTLTQEEWILRQRSQRSQEFAPPSSYHSTKNRNQTSTPSTYQSCSTENEVRGNSDSIQIDPKEQFREERRAEFAPPPSHEYYSSNLKRTKAHKQIPSSNLEAAISKGLHHLRKMSN